MKQVTTENQRENSKRRFIFTRSNLLRYGMHFDAILIILNLCINLDLVYCYIFYNLHVTLDMPTIDIDMLHDIARPCNK